MLLRSILSGSEDKTICVWNATTGGTVAGPFTGHTNSVNSVVFSANGQYIVSGSSDQTIRLWSVLYEETAAGPFTEQLNLNNLEPVVLPHGEYCTLSYQTLNQFLFQMIL